MAESRIAPAVQSPAEQDYTPTIYINLPKNNVGEISDVKVGDMVKVVIMGKVVSKTESQDDQGKMGTISVESKDVNIRQDTTNVFSELADDD